MRATNKTLLDLGSNDIDVSIYSAIEGEIHFKQISNCCNCAVNYQKVCSKCNAILNPEDISKAIEVGEDLQIFDTEKVKLETTNLTLLGLIEDTELNGVFKNGDVWYLTPTIDKKAVARSQKALTKFAYLREAMKESNKSFICAINLRGKEHLVILKPYFNLFVGLGIYHADRIRNMQEISFLADCVTNPEVVKQMSESIKSKQQIAVKDIENKRNKIIENLLLNPQQEIKKEEKEVNLLELVAF
jgi:DNA end-binding protein Ku